MRTSYKPQQVVTIPGFHAFQFPPSYFGIQPEYIQETAGSPGILWFSAAANSQSNMSDGVFTLSHDGKIVRQQRECVPWFSYRGLMWGRGKDGLYIHDEGKWQKAESFPNALPISYTFDEMDRLWITSVSHGVWNTTTGNKWTECTVDTQNERDFLSFVSTDNQGKVWLTRTYNRTKRTSIYTYTDEKWLVSPLSENDKPLKNIGKLYFTQSNDIWADTFNNGVWHYTGSQWRHYQGGRGEQPKTLSGRGVTGFCIDRKDRVWVATQNGLSCFSSNKWSKVFISPLSTDNREIQYVWDIPLASFYFDRANILWIGTQIQAHLGFIDVSLPLVTITEVENVNFITGEKV